MEFKIGDVVILKSGGPRMTIQNIGEYLSIFHKQALSCIWFEGAKKNEDIFHPDSVEHYERPNINVNLGRG
jgi:uncharacterized protein YodC (DUF2158 family)